MEWSNTYPNSDGSYFYSVAQLLDGGYVAVGMTMTIEGVTGMVTGTTTDPMIDGVTRVTADTLTTTEIAGTRTNAA